MALWVVGLSGVVFVCELRGSWIGGGEVRVEVGGCGDSMMWVCSKSIDMIEVLRRLIEG